MPPQPIEFRLESLERRVTNLELLPARIDDLASQILHLRTEMRAEFSAVRGEVAGQGTTLRQEIAEQGGMLRQEMAEQGGMLRQELAEQGGMLRQEMAEQGAALRDEFRSDLRREIDGLATHMRVLHEEVIARIALLGDAAPQARRRRRKT
ncbi:hypothetical protein BH23ACI1_BH23ACI1_14340 [soil metagenome]